MFDTPVIRVQRMAAQTVGMKVVLIVFEIAKGLIASSGHEATLKLGQMRHYTPFLLPYNALKRGRAFLHRGTHGLLPRDTVEIAFLPGRLRGWEHLSR